MLTLVIPGSELFDQEKQEFLHDLDPITLTLEHSLLSLSKWESKHKKPFLSSTAQTSEETLSYVECMILNPDFPPGVSSRMTMEHLDAVTAYIESPESATTFGKMPETKGKGETVTAELIYYWMVAFTIPFECEKWHLNRLFALIKICNIKNSKPKKMSKGELARQTHEMNQRRRAELGTTG